MEHNHSNELDRDATCKAFNEVVNMARAELESWLSTDDSRSVGWTHGNESEFVGQESGRQIVKINRTKKADLLP